MPREWFNDFFGDLYGRVLAGQLTPEQSEAQARLIRRVLGLRRGRRVLDCPCGLGRISLPLARMGLEVTGADLSADYLERARRQARREHLDARFLRADMRDLPFENEFDAVINWFSSFGYFDDAGNLAAARAAWSALRPGGQVLIELLNKSYLLPRVHSGTEETIAGVRIVNRPRWHARDNRMRDTWTMSAGLRRQRRSLCLRLYNGTEIRRLLSQAGFADIRLFGHDAGRLTRFSRHSRRFIVVARKR